MESDSENDFESAYSSDEDHHDAIQNVAPPTKKLKTSDKPKSKKKKNHELYKAPTAEELNKLRDTENLYNSNLFRLQIDGLLDEIKVKTKYTVLFDKWLDEFDKFITNITEYNELKLSEINIQNHKKKKVKAFVKSLLETHKSVYKTDQDIVIKFLKPESYHVFGLHKINLTVGPQLEVKINIVMPKACFLEKDYLNNRYLLKREYYTTYILSELNSSKLFGKLTSHDNAVIEGVPEICANIHIQFYITASSESFKLLRFEPDKNNVKADVFEHFDGINLDKLKEHATPFYNSYILHDLVLKTNYEYIQQCLKDFTNIQSGVKLLLVWLMQRNLCFPNGGFSYELLLNLLVYMTQKCMINQHMSSYQIIRNVWIFLSTSNWHESPICMSNSISPEALKRYHEHFDVVFVNTSCYNIASFLNLQIYLKVKSEAKLAVEYLDETKFDTFKALFLTKMEPVLQYDALLNLTDPSSFKKVYKCVEASDQYKYIGFYKHLIIRKIINVLKERLNKRIVNIVPLLSTEDETSTTELKFGLTLDTEYAFSVIEKGPPANSEAATEFQKFWGSLSQCRRFADGSICEAVYFESNTVRERRKIFKKMIEFILNQKLGVESYKLFCDPFDDTLFLKKLIAPFPIGTNEEATLKVVSLFDELGAKIRQFKLPLEITDLRGTSEVFCFTNTFPPIPTVYKWGNQVTFLEKNNILLTKDNVSVVPHYVEPIECVIQLGKNSKWPKELEILRDTKTVYYLEISKLLNESNILSRVSPSYLEVLFKGIVFRFRLYHPKEIALIKKYTKPDGVTAYKDNEESIMLERELRIRPKIIGALRGLQAQNNCYGVSTTLIKRWLRSQLIDDYYMPDIVLSLLNAYLFIRSPPFERPGLPQVAFLRFIKFFSEFDWNTQFILVNFNNEITKEETDSIQLNFEQNRQAYSLLHIVTPFDEGKNWFTKKCSKEILSRVRMLAQETLSLLNYTIVKDMDFITIEKLFIPNMKGYNVVIQLKPQLNPLRYQQLDFTNAHGSSITLKNYSNDEKSGFPVVDFNVAEKYLHELRKSYGHLAYFFYDSYGGNAIGVLWIPLQKKPFKVSNIQLGFDLQGEELVLNKAAIIEDFNIIGQDLVKHIVEVR